MDISRMKFKTISQDSIIERRSSKPFITLYHNSIYLPKIVSIIIRDNKYKYATLSVSDSVIAIEFLPFKKDGSFEVTIKNDPKSGIIFGSIGSVALCEQIAKEMGIRIDRNRYYKSIDSEIVNNIMYFEFDRNQCIFRKRSK